MKIAITGGTGFVGSHLARSLCAAGHEVVIISRGRSKENADLVTLSGVTIRSVGLADERLLSDTFQGCDAVAHLAGINREIGSQTYEAVHVSATANVVSAARFAGVRRILLLSFLRARPQCGSPYHESKWQAEEIVRNSGIPFTVIKAGVIYGKGDHMVTHISQTLSTLPIFGLLGLSVTPMKPLAVADLVRIMSTTLTAGDLDGRTVAVIGTEELTLRAAVQRIGEVIGVRPLFVPLPLLLHRLLASMCEKIMTVPLVSKAQVRILSEDLTEVLPWADDLPVELKPTSAFTLENIRAALPERKRFGREDFLALQR